MTESELLTKIRTGDESAFLELYNRWQTTVFRFAWQMTGSRSMAEDITQDVFLLLIRKKVGFNASKGNFSSFIYGVARNFSLRALRKNHRYQGILDIFKNQVASESAAGGDPLSNLFGEEMTANLRRCILSLPPRYREVVVLCDLHELSYVEAAAAIHTEIGTVRSRLHRGRELLAQKLRPAQEAQQEKKGGTPYELPAL